ncbi:hypothetical protein LSH36_348g02019 [Paralvinella palmiformis]|uniref:Uncharacterized protein n=1 Tax=Paralvinella palmiformis TaxID=53620 RepID=A0AAD9JEX5_9ANNE|nr:hypothetical protein LSH36_348g02019 [Paralvinella palmiformis]
MRHGTPCYTFNKDNIEHVIQVKQGRDGFPKKSGVLVTFTDLAFHIRSYGDLTDDELEEVVSFLTERIQTQERTELGQLDRLQNTLHSVSHKDVWMCADHVDHGRSDKLKTALRQYFDEQPEIKDGQVTMLSFAREYGSQDQVSVLEKIQCDNIDGIRADIRQFINTYSSEHTLSGRVIARIFHGIGSPCFPPKVWGRVRRFWRCHLDADFNQLRRIATQEIIQFR